MGLRTEILTSLAASAKSGLPLTLVLSLTLSACVGTTDFSGTRVIPATEPAIQEPEDGGASGGPTAAAPTITGVSPSTGPESGGTLVTITGTNFVDGGTPATSSTVRLGTSSCQTLTVVNSGQIDCVSPARPPAVVDVVVINPDTQVAREVDGFAFTDDLYVCYNGVCPPSGNVPIGINQTRTFAATGGVPPYTYRNLPLIDPNLFVGADFTAPGAPDPSITIQVTDSNGATATATVEVLGAPVISADTNANIVEGTTKTFNVVAGVPPFDYSIVTAPTAGCASLLPDDTDTTNTYISVKANSGCNAGVTGTLTVTDSEGNSGNIGVTFYDTISVARSDDDITTDTCSSPVTITPSGGLPASGTDYEFSVTPGCSGCTLNGVVQSTDIAPTLDLNTGASTSPGTYTITVTDSENNTGSTTVTVNALPQFTVSTGGVWGGDSYYDFNSSTDTIDIIESSTANLSTPWYLTPISGGRLPMGTVDGVSYIYNDGGDGAEIDSPLPRMPAYLYPSNGEMYLESFARITGTDETITWYDDCGKPATITIRVHDKATLPADTIVVTGYSYTAPITNHDTAYGIDSSANCDLASGPGSIGYSSADEACTFISYSTGTAVIRVRDDLGSGDGNGIYDEQTITINNPIAITPTYYEVIPGQQVTFSVASGTGMAGTTFSKDYGPGDIPDETLGDYIAPGFAPALAQIRVVDSSGIAGSNVGWVKTVAAGTQEENWDDTYGYLQTWTSQIYEDLMWSDVNNRDKVGIPFVSAKDSTRTDFSRGSLAVAKQPAVNGTVAFFAGSYGHRADTSNEHSGIFLHLQDLDWDYGSNTAYIDSSYYHGGQNVTFDSVDIVPNIPGEAWIEETAIFSATSYGSGTSEKFVVAGWHDNGNDRDMLVIQYNSSFVREWIFTYDLDGSGTHEEAGAVAYDPTNNRLLVAGVVNRSTETSDDGFLLLLGLTTSGSLDPTIDNQDGMVVIDVNMSGTLRHAFDIEVDGTDIYVAGTSGGYGFVAKFEDPEANGDFAQSYDFDCTNASPLFYVSAFQSDTAANTYAMTVRVNPADSTELIVGAYMPDGDDVGAASIKKVDGCLDTGFGGDGWAEVGITATHYGGMVALADGAINIVASHTGSDWTFGGVQPGDNANDLYIVRVDTAGAISAVNLNDDAPTVLNDDLEVSTDPGHDYDMYHAGGVALIPHTIGSQTIYRLLIPGAFYQDTRNAVDEDRWVLDGKVFKTY